MELDPRRARLVFAVIASFLVSVFVWMLVHPSSPDGPAQPARPDATASATPTASADPYSSPGAGSWTATAPKAFAIKYLEAVNTYNFRTTLPAWQSRVLDAVDPGAADPLSLAPLSDRELVQCVSTRCSSRAKATFIREETPGAQGEYSALYRVTVTYLASGRTIRYTSLWFVASSADSPKVSFAEDQRTNKVMND